MPVCDVCGQDKPDVRWCNLCKANICRSCRPRYLARAKAALDRHFGNRP